MDIFYIMGQKIKSHHFPFVCQLQCNFNVTPIPEQLPSYPPAGGQTSLGLAACFHQFRIVPLIDFALFFLSSMSVPIYFLQPFLILLLFRWRKSCEAKPHPQVVYHFLNQGIHWIIFNLSVPAARFWRLLYVCFEWYKFVKTRFNFKHSRVLQALPIVAYYLFVAGGGGWVFLRDTSCLDIFF